MNSSENIKEKMVKFLLILTFLFSIANLVTPNYDFFLTLSLSNILLLGTYFVIKKNHVIIDSMAATSKIMNKVRSLEK